MLCGPSPWTAHKLHTYSGYDLKSDGRSVHTSMGPTLRPRPGIRDYSAVTAHRLAVSRARSMLQIHRCNVPAPEFTIQSLGSKAAQLDCVTT